MAVAVTFDGNQELRKLVKDFKKLPPALRKELRPALQRGAQPVLMQSRANSSWSARIPKATRISPKLGKRRGGVVIAVSNRRAPHARPYENLGNPGTFRHPVYWPRARHMVFGVERPGAFKDGPWVSQAAKPFLFRAVEQKGGEVTKELAKTVIAIGRKHGWDR